MTLPVPILIFPFLATVGACVFGLGYGLVIPYVETFDEASNIICGGVIDTIPESFKNLG